MNKKLKVLLVALSMFLLYKGYLNLTNEIISLNHQLAESNAKLNDIISQLNQLNVENESILSKKDVSFQNVNTENNTVECVVSLTLKKNFKNEKVVININDVAKNTELINGNYVYREVLPINSNLKLGLVSVENNFAKEVEDLNYEISVLNSVLGECYINVPWEYDFFQEENKDDNFEIEFSGGIYASFQDGWNKIPEKIDFVLVVNDKEKYRESITPNDKGSDYFMGDINNKKYKFLKGDKVQVNFEVGDEYGYIHIISKFYKIMGNNDFLKEVELIQTVKDKNGNFI